MMGLFVRFLVASKGTRASELSGLAATGISYQQGLVMLDEHVFDNLSQKPHPRVSNNGRLGLLRRSGN